MFQNDLAQLEAAASALDCELLDEFLFPRPRHLNPSLTFQAPLMLSAHRVKHLANIPKLKSDAVILNLDEGGEEEIRVLGAFMPDAIRVPKIRTLKEVQKVLELVPEPIEIHLSIETKEAWLALASLRPDPRVTCFYLGILDLFADMGLDQALITPQNPTMGYMLSHFLVTCRALGVKPVSFVYQDYQDESGFDQWLTLEREMGYDAKGCLSPRQAEQTMQAFASDEERFERAREIVALFEAQREKGVTGFKHKAYGFIDEPIYKGALALLKRQE